MNGSSSSIIAPSVSIGRMGIKRNCDGSFEMNSFTSENFHFFTQKSFEKNPQNFHSKFLENFPQNFPQNFLENSSNFSSKNLFDGNWKRRIGYES